MERSLTHVALFAALIAVLGFMPKLDLASGVPVSAQSLAIMLCGTILGAKRGALAVLLFLALVALGLPLLAGGRGGLGSFVGPTAGYLIGFPLAALTAGWVMERTTLPAFWAATTGAIIGGIGVLYICGIIGMAITLQKPLHEAAYLGLVFLPGDILKAVLTGFITQAIARARPSALMSRA